MIGKRHLGVMLMGLRITLEELALFMRDYIALNLSRSITAGCGVMELLALPLDERPNDYRKLTSELQAIKTVMQADECPEEIGVIPDKSPAEDLGLREETLEDLANVVKSNLETLAPHTASSSQGVAQPLAAWQAAKYRQSLTPLPRRPRPPREELLAWTRLKTKIRLAKYI